jgi:hypothetical protein
MQVANFFSERVERHQEMKLPNSRSLELSRRQTSCFTFCNGGGFRFGIFDTCPGKKLIYTRRDRREFLSQHVGTVCVFINFFRSFFFSGIYFWWCCRDLENQIQPETGLGRMWHDAHCNRISLNRQLIFRRVESEDK